MPIGVVLEGEGFPVRATERDVETYVQRYIAISLGIHGDRGAEHLRICPVKPRRPLRKDLRLSPSFPYEQEHYDQERDQAEKNTHRFPLRFALIGGASHRGRMRRRASHFSTDNLGASTAKVN